MAENVICSERARIEAVFSVFEEAPALLCAARGMSAEEEAMTTVITQEDASAINWYRELTPVEKRTFWACFGGWALDAMDVQIFSFVIPAIIIAFAITNADAGLIGTVTLLTSAFGGWFAGALADRFGRVRTLPGAAYSSARSRPCRGAALESLLPSGRHPPVVVEPLGLFSEVLRKRASSWLALQGDGLSPPNSSLRHLEPSGPLTAGPRP
jgi:hypothetical protein